MEAISLGLGHPELASRGESIASRFASEASSRRQSSSRFRENSCEGPSAPSSNPGTAKPSFNLPRNSPGSRRGPVLQLSPFPGSPFPANAGKHFFCDWNPNACQQSSGRVVTVYWEDSEGVLEPVVGFERFVLCLRDNSAQFAEWIKLSVSLLGVSRLISVTEEFT